MIVRIIKRYESRKLYDTEESRYVSLKDIAMWVRNGQEVRVIDNATSGDVTAQILTQIIHDEGKRGTSILPTELLHDLVRVGQEAVNTGVEQVQGTVDRVLKASIDRLGPVCRARNEMSHLRDRLSKLETTLKALETEAAQEAEAESAKKTRPAKKPAAKTAKPAAKTAKPASKAARKPARAAGRRTRQTAKKATVH